VRTWESEFSALVKYNLFPDTSKVLFAAGNFLSFFTQQASTFVCILSNFVSGRLHATEFIKKQRLNWLGYVELMVEGNNVQKIKRWKPMSKRPIGRPKTRWEKDVLEDIRNVNGNN